MVAWLAVGELVAEVVLPDAWPDLDVTPEGTVGEVAAAEAFAR